MIELILNNLLLENRRRGKMPDEPISVQAGVPAHVPPAGGAEPPANQGDATLETITPEEFRDRPYLKTAGDIPGLFKMLDGSQKLIGQKVIPSGEASAEEVDEFYNKLRPEEAGKYDLKFDEKTAENTAYTDGVKGLFHKAGLSQHQAKLLQEGFPELVKSVAPTDDGKAKEADVNFDNLAAKHFGADEPKIMENSKALIDKFTPEGMKEHVEALPNESLIVMAAVLNGIQKEFISEDNINNLKGGGNTTHDIPTLQAEGRKLMASDEYNNTFHPDHEKVKARTTEIYANISKLQQMVKK